MSKTVNLLEDALVEAAREVFILARWLRFKSVTVYPYGSRVGEALSDKEYC